MKKVKFHMRVRTSSSIKELLACLFLLSFVSFLHAAEDRRFTLKDGVIDDSKLGLQWGPAPDRRMNQYQAEEYARNLSLAGGGWRLPTRAELNSLYDPSLPDGTDPVLSIKGNWVWTSELDVENPSRAWIIRFSPDNWNTSDTRDGSNNGDHVVLVVRSKR